MEKAIWAPQIKKNGVPVMSVSWSWRMTDPVKRYVFTPGNDNKDEIKIMMDYIVHNMKAKDPRIAFVAPDVEYAKSGFNVAKAKAKEYNVTLVERIILAMDALDATTQVLRLKKNRVTHTIAATLNGPSLVLLKSAKRLNYFPVFFNSFHAFGDEIVKSAGQGAKNLYGAGAFGSWFDDTPGIDELKKISHEYEPNMEIPNRYYVKGWISSKIVHEGILRANKDLNPETFVNSLETIKDLDMKGLTGPITYSREVHKGNSYARLYKADIEKGYLIPVTGWIKPQ